MVRRRLSVEIIVIILTSLIFITACGQKETPAGNLQPLTGQSGRLKVVVTTTLVSDVVKNVGGDRIDVHVLIPPDMDEHSFEPAPQDIARVAEADLLFTNGAGLEGFIDKLARNAGGQARVVVVSEGITLQTSQTVEEDSSKGDRHNEAEDKHGSGDPHVWTDPNNVLVWVDNIEQALSEADPDGAETYRASADDYRKALRDLDIWVRQHVEQVPEERRLLVTDHTVFTYFASRYGFKQVGAIVPGYSTGSSPSAQELAALEDAIHDLAVPAVFVGNTVNPAAAERVAQDTQTKLVHVLTGSLTGADGPAPTYIDYMRYNVTSIVEALK